MKKYTLCTAMMLATLVSFGQCDKDVTLTASKTSYMDGSGALQRTVDEQSTIEINKSKVTITPGNVDHKMTGTVQSVTCNWSKPFEVGKTVMKAIFEDPAGGNKNTTLTIEGKDGTVTFLMEITEMPDKKILVKVDSFKETKKD